jgi:hypothetical protein
MLGLQHCCAGVEHLVLQVEPAGPRLILTGVAARRLSWFTCSVCEVRCWGVWHVQEVRVGVHARKHVVEGWPWRNAVIKVPHRSVVVLSQPRGKRAIGLERHAVAEPASRWRLVTLKHLRYRVAVSENFAGGLLIGEEGERLFVAEQSPDVIELPTDAGQP